MRSTKDPESPAGDAPAPSAEPRFPLASDSRLQAFPEDIAFAAKDAARMTAGLARPRDHACEPWAMGGISDG